MPYKDPEKQRAAEREAQRRRRAGLTLARQTPRHTLPGLAELRLDSARGALALLAEEVKKVRGIPTPAGGDAALVMSKARTVAYLVSVGLRALEVGEVEQRLEALERLVGSLTEGAA